MYHAVHRKETTGRYRKKTWVFALCMIVIFGIALVGGGVLLYLNNVDYVKGNDIYDKISFNAQAAGVAAELEPRDVGEDEDAQAAQAYISPVSFDELRAVNPDVKAWLLSEGVIEYPVVKGEDNEYYLTHIFTGEENKLGCLFIDFRNTGDFTDKNTVIYGHNMKSGAMFANLMEYKEQAYYDMFPSMTLYMPTSMAKIEFFAGVLADGDYEFLRFDFENDDDFMSYVAELKAESTFESSVDVKPTDTLVTLCTCSYEFNNARYALVGRLVQ